MDKLHTYPWNPHQPQHPLQLFGHCLVDAKAEDEPAETSSTCPKAPASPQAAPKLLLWMEAVLPMEGSFLLCCQSPPVPWEEPETQTSGWHNCHLPWPCEGCERANCQSYRGHHGLAACALLHPAQLPEHTALGDSLTGRSRGTPVVSHRSIWLQKPTICPRVVPTKVCKHPDREEDYYYTSICSAMWTAHQLQPEDASEPLKPTLPLEKCKLQEAQGSHGKPIPSKHKSHPQHFKLAPFPAWLNARSINRSHQETSKWWQHQYKSTDWVCTNVTNFKKY